MGSRYPRLMWAAPFVTALAATLTASGPPAAEGPAVRAISSRMDGALSTVLIESTEPVAYLTSQPDPLTVFVDLRNARSEGFAGGSVGAMQPPVSGVQLESRDRPRRGARGPGARRPRSSGAASGALVAQSDLRRTGSPAAGGLESGGHELRRR